MICTIDLFFIEIICIIDLFFYKNYKGSCTFLKKL